MSLLVDGQAVARVSYFPAPQSYISPAFRARCSGVSGSRLSASAAITGDVVLGLDWAAVVREYLTRDGYRLNWSFDPWTFFTSGPHPPYIPNSLIALPVILAISSGGLHGPTPALFHIYQAIWRVFRWTIPALFRIYRFILCTS
ncbi:hypothetical protein C8F04DRAFT_1409022 [Mycena alexandri]|uniref:Uncharacterized protein n=1 Tax=Mycena alexandri TaxID=1745969 RepID=A0AAD6RV53_9AGAR|nr:hypothetical protein C8F04DRAFT_1409022 [Mycena alexandri]